MSPRVGVVWDPKGDGNWSVTASFARYVAAVANSIADRARRPPATPRRSSGRTPGPADQPDATRRRSSTTQTAIQQVFNWCQRDATGFCTVAAPIVRQLGAWRVRQDSERPDSPNVREYAFGVSRQLSNRAAVRADYSYRDYRDFYSQRIDTTTGTATDSLGNPTDLAIVENTNDLKRRYSGLTFVGDLPRQRPDRRRRQLHAVASLGQFRRRERRQRARSRPPTLPVSRNTASSRGTRRKAICRPISVTARDVDQLRRAESRRPDAQLPPEPRPAACRTAPSARSTRGRSSRDARLRRRRRAARAKPTTSRRATRSGRRLNSARTSRPPTTTASTRARASWICSSRPRCSTSSTNFELCGCGASVFSQRRQRPVEQHQVAAQSVLTQRRTAPARWRSSIR